MTCRRGSTIFNSPEFFSNNQQGKLTSASGPTASWKCFMKLGRMQHHLNDWSWKKCTLLLIRIAPNSSLRYSLWRWLWKVGHPSLNPSHCALMMIIKWKGSVQRKISLLRVILSLMASSLCKSKLLFRSTGQSKTWVNYQSHLTFLWRASVASSDYATLTASNRSCNSSDAHKSQSMWGRCWAVTKHQTLICSRYPK